jgi:hypothetical protein
MRDIPEFKKIAVPEYRCQGRIFQANPQTLCQQHPYTKIFKNIYTSTLSGIMKRNVKKLKVTSGVK